MEDEGDRLLPIANVGRIMKQTLPVTAKISKGAKERMQECATEFISFVTAEASDKCHKENRKTVNGDDICWALSSLGFDNYAEVMMRYLHKYREIEKDKASSSSHGKAGEGEGEGEDGSIEKRGEVLRGLGTSGVNLPLEFRIIDNKESFQLAGCSYM
ncbi:hypothetical protein Cgig2_017036 [Carnegiea gigantea]|uniref:Transcription factor CBF/NF-Y/archaeal histone domain-containing protein n=1 Tax=Carnegiea gigantea TaxID=171969 RepID=A0A9Q1KIQ3_9CARY|nr:hypothetical protein Cgig2_017036 [Carnegiea gigantea]